MRRQSCKEAKFTGGKIYRGRSVWLVVTITTQYNKLAVDTMLDSNFTDQINLVSFERSRTTPVNF